MKILKIKVGEVFIDGKAYPVFNTAFPKTSKDGKTTYYTVNNPVFVQEVKEKPKFETIKPSLDL